MICTQLLNNALQSHFIGNCLHFLARRGTVLELEGRPAFPMPAGFVPLLFPRKSPPPPSRSAPSSVHNPQPTKQSTKPRSSQPADCTRPNTLLLPQPPRRLLAATRSSLHLALGERAHFSLSASSNNKTPTSARATGKQHKRTHAPRPQDNNKQQATRARCCRRPWQSPRSSRRARPSLL